MDKENKMQLRQKLSRIQEILNVSKKRVNKFGGYKYWNCSDILAEAKKHYGEYRVSIILDDTVECIGDRFYIKATATMICADSAEAISVSAFAREPSSVKGQSEAQISGASSSYARKYALSGLLSLDDEQDADSTNNHGKTVPVVKTEKIEEEIF
jgi:predicted metal-binding protein